MTVENPQIRTLVLATSVLGFVCAGVTLLFAWQMFSWELRLVTVISAALFGVVWPLYRFVVPHHAWVANIANQCLPGALFVSCGFAAVYAAGQLPLAAIYAPAIPLLSVMICGTMSAVVWSTLMLLAFGAGLVFGPLAPELVTPKPQMALIGGMVVLIPTLICLILHRSIWAEAVQNERKLRNQLAMQHAHQRDLDKRLSEHARAESLALMAGRIAHDLNNFLTSVSGNASLAALQLKDGDGAGVAESVQAIEVAAADAGELARQLLDYSGKRQLTLKKFSLGDRVKNAIVLARAAIPATVSVDLNIGADVQIEGDPIQIDQVVVNLVRNAAESYEGVGTPPRVEVVVNARWCDAHTCFSGNRLPSGAYAELLVKDQGVGIGEFVQDRIFEPFYTSKQNGKGLGLASVWGIVEAHGGGISVSTQPGVGTTFAVLIPKVDPALTIAPPRTVELAVTSNSSFDVVLIADDQPEVRSVVGRLVARLGFKPQYASDGVEALSILESDHPKFAALVLDVVMPTLDGVSVVKTMRQQSLDLPVVLISGYSNADAAADVMGDPRVVFLQKPFSAQMLTEAFSTLNVAVDRTRSIPRNV